VSVKTYILIVRDEPEWESASTSLEAVRGYALEWTERGVHCQIAELVGELRTIEHGSLVEEWNEAQHITETKWRAFQPEPELLLFGANA
jgi:hypothetical protein